MQISTQVAVEQSDHFLFTSHLERQRLFSQKWILIFICKLKAKLCCWICSFIFMNGWMYVVFTKFWKLICCQTTTCCPPPTPPPIPPQIRMTITKAHCCIIVDATTCFLLLIILVLLLLLLLLIPPSSFPNCQHNDNVKAHYCSNNHLLSYHYCNNNNKIENLINHSIFSGMSLRYATNSYT